MLYFLTPTHYERNNWDADAAVISRVLLADSTSKVNAGTNHSRKRGWTSQAVEVSKVQDVWAPRLSQLQPPRARRNSTQDLKQLLWYPFWPQELPWVCSKFCFSKFRRWWRRDQGSSPEYKTALPPQLWEKHSETNNWGAKSLRRSQIETLGLSHRNCQWDSPGKRKLICEGRAHRQICS